ncbi:hypothetical protein ES705_11652 [subsurface metagenome]
MDPKKSEKENQKGKMENLDNVKEDLASGKGKDKKTKKPKIGRPTKEELEARKTEEEQALLESMPDSESFEDLLDFLFNFIAERLGPHWKLKPEEKRKGGVLVSNVAAKYFPLIGEYSAEVALLMWAAPVLLVRYQITAALSQLDEDVKKEAEGKGGKKKEETSVKNG